MPLLRASSSALSSEEGASSAWRTAPLVAVTAVLAVLLLIALAALHAYRRRMALRQPKVVLGRPTPVQMRADEATTATSARVQVVPTECVSVVAAVASVVGTSVSVVHLAPGAVSLVEPGAEPEADVDVIMRV